jgi:hypothetical protein
MPRVMKAFALVAVLVLAATGSVTAESDVPQKQVFVTRLQEAVRANDKAWLAAHTRYPLRSFGSRQPRIRDQSSFIKHYASLINPGVRAAVLAQDPANVFENWQGLMIGEGLYNIWVRNAGDRLNERYQIITINSGRQLRASRTPREGQHSVARRRLESHCRALYQRRS